MGVDKESMSGSGSFCCDIGTTAVGNDDCTPRFLLVTDAKVSD
jgi:hypothetical protein